MQEGDDEEPSLLRRYSYHIFLTTVVLMAGAQSRNQVSQLFHQEETLFAPQYSVQRKGSAIAEQWQGERSDVWSDLFRDFNSTRKAPPPSGTLSEPPGWWKDPRQCTTLAFDCSRMTPASSGKEDEKQGDHICAVDTCRRGKAASIWPDVSSHWSDLLDTVKHLPPRVQFLAIGDSTNQQQARSLNCFLEEAMGTWDEEVDLVIFDDKSDSTKARRQEVPNRWKRVACRRGILHMTDQREIMVCIRWASKSFFGEHDVPKIIEENLLARGDDTDVHIVILVNMGAWFNCDEQHCDTWHTQLRRFQSWWKSYNTKAPNTTLIIRDALPQHFRTRDGRYGKPTRHVYGCPALTDRSHSGLQAVKVRDPRTCPSGRSVTVEDPDHALFRNPVWAVTARLPVHNVQRGDCTHYCTAVSTLWNIMMLGIVVKHYRNTHDVTKRDRVGGERMASLLVSKSFEETRLDLLAANGMVC